MVPCGLITSLTWYTPEEDDEKERVAGLTPFEKDMVLHMELRDLDRQLALLNMRRGINTGELYTTRGKLKALSRDYGDGGFAHSQPSF